MSFFWHTNCGRSGDGGDRAASSQGSEARQVNLMRISRFRKSNHRTRSTTQASPSEILECFRDERDLLLRIALLITGKVAAAEPQSLVDARNLVTSGPVPFHDWLVTWAVRVTSILNCALQLGISTSTAVVANCRVMSWLRDATQQRRPEHAS